MSARLTAAYRGGALRDGRAGWRIQFRYNFDTIAALKRAIPAQDREWIDTGAYWWIAEAHEDALRALFPGLDAYLRQPKLL